jgi:hypothetical protein
MKIELSKVDTVTLHQGVPSDNTSLCGMNLESMPHGNMWTLSIKETLEKIEKTFAVVICSECKNKLSKAI